MEDQTLQPISANPHHCEKSFALPRVGDAVPGHLHTIVVDTAGNMYYSDEFNHSVVSLDGDGALRWHKTKRGTAAGEFWYPRGLSIGSLQVEGETVQCLGIADAWHRRVQFLDLDGKPRAVWTHGGGEAFGEVSDVRFIPEGADSNAGFWYVLDRGNHRLYRIGQDGVILDRMGQQFPQNLEKSWSVPALFFSDAANLDSIRCKIAPHDFSFYPNRILGNSADALYLCEADSRRLKVVIPPHLLPVCRGYKGELQWIMADESGFLAWNRDESMLIRFLDEEGENDQARINGEPIMSNISFPQFWLQAEDSIQRMRWNYPVTYNKKKHLGSNPWMFESAAEEMRLIDPAAAEQSINSYLAEVDKELEIADYIVGSADEHFVAQTVDKLLERLYWLKIRCNSAMSELRGALHHWSVGKLLCLFAKVSESQAQITSANKLLNDLHAKIEIRLEGIRERINTLDRKISQMTAADSDTGELRARLDAARISKEALKYLRELVLS
jgi:hypothetical protein